MSLEKAEQSDILELNKQILEGKKASQTVCEYVDWLLSTYNPDPPEDGFWIKPLHSSLPEATQRYYEHSTI